MGHRKNKKIVRSREITNICMECNGLTDAEKSEIVGLIRRMAAKRKRDNQPRLLYYVKLED